MPIDEEEFKRRKRRAEIARQTRDKASGQLEAAMDRLRVDFGCNTIKEAEKLAAKLTEDVTRAEATYNKAAIAFEEEWDDRLES